MARWITNWPVGAAAKKWASCSPAMAAQIAAEGKCQVRLVKNTIRLSRHVVMKPDFIKTGATLLPAASLANTRAVATALRLSPLDRFRQEQRRAA